ncbi:hypothetical protein BDZ89DRAFT_1102588 [Hymenopellis radicata]|nr:hypothetical protein BDZ89DRAFT_1102588 [Hymenopellis radicata]
MTITQRKPAHADDIIINEPGDQYNCDACECDLTHSVRIKCADPVCELGDGVDICPRCFCAGKEHPYRVIEMNSYPIFTEDWGADEELLLLKGIASQGFGNWKKIAEHIGTRTKEEVERHYKQVYIKSQNWPIPPMDREFTVDQTEWTKLPSPVKPTPVSLPGIHEIQGYFPGRLEFEHEIDNEAEDLVKDLEFGVCLEWGGDEIIEDENDLDVKARQRWEEERRNPQPLPPPPLSYDINGRIPGKGPAPMQGIVNGVVNGFHPPSESSSVRPKSEDRDGANGTASGDEEEVEEVTQPPPVETKESLAFKLTLMEMYAQRVKKRLDGKAVILDRGLLEHKKMQAADKKRSREERDILHRLRPFSQLQTAKDYEDFSNDILYEALLRHRIAELQSFRRLGLQTAGDIEKYKTDVQKRATAKANHRDYAVEKNRAGGRQSSGPDPSRRGSHIDSDGHEREGTPRPGTSTLTARKPPQPLNIANSPSLHLLSPGEQGLCSSLRILPKPYLAIKETLVREYARRGGKLRRREARDLVKIDVNKTSRIWDFLVQAGFLKINVEPTLTQTPRCLSYHSATASVNGSPVKDSNQISRTPSIAMAAPPLPGPSLSSLPSLPGPVLPNVPSQNP